MQGTNLDDFLQEVQTLQHAVSTDGGYIVANSTDGGYIVANSRPSSLVRFTQFTCFTGTKLLDCRLLYGRDLA